MDKEKQIKEAIESLKYLISGDCTGNQMDFVEEIQMAIQALENKQIEAEWIDRQEKTWCSLCGASNKQYKPPFCPHCGARMKGVLNERKPLSVL